MPILNPQQAFNMIESHHKKADHLLHFFNFLLPIASNKIDESRKMEKIYQQFMNFIMSNITKVCDFFHFTNEEIILFQDVESNNLYQIFYNKLKNTNKPKNTYSLTNLDFAGELYQSIKNPGLSLPETKSLFHIVYYDEDSIGVYLSLKSYALITYHTKSFNKKKNNFEEAFIFDLISYILAAAGYTLILCYYDNKNTFNILSKKLKTSLFSEIHIFTDISDNLKEYNINSLLSSDNGYIYIYAYSYIPDNSQYLKKCNTDKTKVFIFSKKLIEIFGAKKACSDQDLCIDWNFNDKLLINLCNIPLYKTNNRDDWTPVELSGISEAEIIASDFDYSDFKRVLITKDEKKYYIDFVDLHFMNPELYISEPMYLAEQKFKISIVDNINKTYMNDTTNMEKFKVKNSDINANVEEKMHYAFHHLFKHSSKLKNPIKPYSSQIYAVYQAVSYLGLHKNKGVILQVHTGEGKSFIVQILAEQLARQGNIVHIATSNILLAARDFEKAYEYYKYCEKKAVKYTLQKEQRPSILLHEKEKKYIKNFLSNLDDEIEKESFYNQENFENPTNMNISVCQNNKKMTSNIVYSTFLNFEAFYLNENEKNPNYLQKYINNCFLIIDEADTILIDELPNGTIIAKPMKSNGVEVLEFVYNQFISGNDKSSSILNLVCQKFPECKEDMTIDHIDRMISDIKKVRAKDFCIDKRYIIKEDERDKKLKVIPFDSDHKGISEPNKEFSGFIHQFIGIKEKNDHPALYQDLEIQPLSMNYLFISHPIYVNKYKGVCGVTGTIGTEEDVKTLEKYYDLITHKVPRHQMNLRKDLPLILCDDSSERIKYICTEVKKFHEMEYPVLVVFNDINEIKMIRKILITDYKIDDKKILNFFGNDTNTNEKSKKQLEEESGKPSMITLGTNFCGRGISINYVEKPLCVIVTYYNEDKRSINQALGRAGRNGYPGITRIICTKEMYFEGDKKPDQDAMITILKDYYVKNQAQLRFANDIRKKHSWVFDETKFDKEMTKENIECLKQYHININRLTAFNWKFPICMSYKTFFKIQIQRIFSIKNCPECKYTWNLFKNYMRELVLESWSLFLNQLDADYEKLGKPSFIFHNIDYSDIPQKQLYSNFFSNEYKLYITELYKYFPTNEEYTIADAFIHIHNMVGNEWENKVMCNIPEKIRKKNYVTHKKNFSYTSFRIGFFPLSLCEKSGSRITPLNDYEQEKSDKCQSYIIDPELKYLKKDSRDTFSITCAIDSLYEKFQEVFDEKLLGLFGVRFFLRRTLGGCEFGICVDPKYECGDLKDDKGDILYNYLVDKDPIILFTICTKSTFFWIAGILMVLLVFITSVATFIYDHFLKAKIGTTAVSVLKKGLVAISKVFEKRDDEEESSQLSKITNSVFDLIIKYLISKVTTKIYDDDEGFGILAQTFIGLFFPLETNKIDEKLNEEVFSRIKINDNFKKYIGNDQPFGKMIKIGILLIVLIAQFIMNFKNKLAIKFTSYSNKTANSYQKEDDKKKTKDISKFESYKNIKKDLEKNIQKDYSD